MFFVYERLLEEILSGKRPAGAPLRDRDIAGDFAVSRTPVREAIQILRHIGVVEASASRYTRVACLGPRDIVESWHLARILYEEVVRDVVEAGREIPIAAMEQSYQTAADALRDDDLQRCWLRIFDIFDHVLRLISSPYLSRAIWPAATALRVAVVTNRELLDAPRVLHATREGLDAFHEHDEERWRRSMAEFAAMEEEMAEWRGDAS